jgi:hypothetical protein
MDHNLAIITPVYQNYDVLQDFISSLEKQTNKNFQVFFVDLSDNKKPISSKNLNISVSLAENLGYAHGVNIGIKEALKAGFEKFCVMNNDTYAADNFVDKIIKSIDKNHKSLIGGKIYYASGFEYHKDRYQKNELGKVFWYAGGIMDWKNVFTNHRGVDLVDHGQFNKLEETEFISGCLACFDKSLWKIIGPWNENYFLYFEDADYSELCKRSGLKLIYDPNIVLWHKVSQSTDGSGSSLHKKYQDKNRLIFGLKYAPWRTKLHLIKNYFLNRT